VWQDIPLPERNRNPKRMDGMKREELTEKILDAKREKSLTWKEICATIGGGSPIQITAGRG
jgi:cyanate lyase